MSETLAQPYQQFWNDISTLIPESRRTCDPLRTLAYGTDASFYRLIPRIVLEIADEDEVSRVLQLAGRHGTPVTFRAAGTSLSGQALSDSVLLRLGHGWRAWSIAENAEQMTLQPGVIGGQANAHLAAYRRKIGPDPASINAAMIGGIAANNASGMCCGVAQNSYQTVHSMRVILADGALLDTGDPASREAFARTHGQLLEGLRSLARRTRQDAALAERIRHKFRIKNTTGYSLNAMVDFEDPIDVLQHLMIGSEGTLGFIAEITYRTVPDYPHKASALVFFPDVEIAARAVAILKSEPVDAVELMDRAALRCVQDKPGMPEYLAGLSAEAAALLIETRAESSVALAGNVRRIAGTINSVETLFPVHFTDRVEEYTKLWNVRKGLFPSVGAVRASGTTVIIEDVAFSVPQLAAATLDLQALFARHGYSEAIIFGHALEGNLHFVITQDFGTAAEVERYRLFMDELCHLVVEKYDGSLKAEHSTGRNIAPYVELEWGADAYRLMRELKALLDPAGILNPGVILNDDPQIHVENLKPMAAVDPLVDKCIECGFCEPDCPSRALTLTPRQRIVGLREMARLEESGEAPARLEEIRRRYHYQGVVTCAGDSLCSIACPVGIDTGKMMKTLRGRALGGRGLKLADWLGGRFATVAAGTRLGLATADVCHGALGSRAMGLLTGGARRLSGGRVPLWNRAMPTAARGPRAHHPGESSAPRVVYFPSCACRTMGPARDDPACEPLHGTVESLLTKAGYEWVYPAGLDGLCCGMPFESKGAFQAADGKLRELESALMRASRGARDPVLYDTSPCAFRSLQNLESDLKILDLTEFIHDELLGRLRITPVDETVAIHATCSNRKMALNAKLKGIAEACALEVIVPEDVTCCGWAGDKGFSVPELNASAVRSLRPSLPEACLSGYSTSRTCEIGLSLHSGRPYRSIAWLVDRCSVSRA